MWSRRETRRRVHPRRNAAVVATSARAETPPGTVDDEWRGWQEQLDQTRTGPGATFGVVLGPVARLRQLTWVAQAERPPPGSPRWSEGFCTKSDFFRFKPPLHRGEPGGGRVQAGLGVSRSIVLRVSGLLLAPRSARPAIHIRRELSMRALLAIGLAFSLGASIHAEPPGALARLGKLQARKSTDGAAVAFSADGKRIAWVTTAEGEDE